MSILFNFVIVYARRYVCIFIEQSIKVGRERG